MSPCGRGIKINLLFLVWGKWGICSFGGGKGQIRKNF
jgi:chromate transport protein ChrA